MNKKALEKMETQADKQRDTVSPEDTDRCV